MQPLSSLILAAAALGLSACVGTASLRLPNDHPASPTAAAGPVDVPTALADYKGSDSFVAPATADSNAPSGGYPGMVGMPHDGMSGMQHGTAGHDAMPGMSGGDVPGMPAMQHGGATRGAGSQ